MEQGGRSLAHDSLDEIRILAVQCMAEGEHRRLFQPHLECGVSDKISAQARGHGRGLPVPLSMNCVFRSP